MTTARVGYSVPILRVKDVERSVHFYELLGFTATAVLRTEDGVAYWANLSCYRGNPDERTSENESAAVMVSLGEDPVDGGVTEIDGIGNRSETEAKRSTGAPIDASKQCASLYLFSKDLTGLRAQLVSQGVEVTEIVAREYMPKGEMELRDPDGWRVFVGGV
jgi:catechol 2,3-dioxygenase-like lactoylglutathione lyase family enzyme